jgi:hypothetical protein
MSATRLVSRCLLLLVLAALAACKSSHAVGPHTRPVCPGSNDDRQSPVVCIDDAGGKLSFLPEPVVIHNVKHDDPTAPVPITFFALTRSRRLNVVPVDAGCVTTPVCNGPRCSAESIPTQNTLKVCKYEVWLDKGTATELHEDPIIIITGCCS